MLQAGIEEEVRKIQLTGRSTYIVSVPKKWVKRMKLNPGDLVTIVRQDDGSLIILPRSYKESKGLLEATINVSSDFNPDSLVRKIISLYLVGYNVINIKVDKGRISSIQRDAVKDVARRSLVGTEIVADSSDHLSLQVLLSLPEMRLDNALRRMYLIAASMHRDVMSALRDFDKELARDVMKTDDEVDRFGLFTIRILKLAVQNEHVLRETGLQSARDCLGYRLIVKSVERVADHAAKIAEHIVSMVKPIPHEYVARIAEVNSLACSVFEASLESLFRRDYSAADMVIRRCEEVAEEERSAAQSVAESLDSIILSTVRFILEGCRRTAEYASDIAEVVLNLTVTKTLQK